MAQPASATLKQEHPSPEQKAFLRKYVLDQPGMVYTIKAVTRSASSSCNIRGPFRLSKPYTFKSIVETVLEPTWAEAKGEVESNAHAHIPWSAIREVRLVATNAIVRQNIQHDFQLNFLDIDGQALFWFYIKDDRHPAVKDRSLRQGVGFKYAAASSEAE